MARWFLIGGAAGSGKSSLVRAIGEADNSAVMVRPVDSFFRIASKIGFQRQRSFELAESHEDAILEDVLSRVRGADVILSDVHYAIQPVRDSTFAASGYWGDDASEPYVAALSTTLLQRASERDGHSIIAVLLWAKSDLILRRLAERDGHSPRNLRSIDVNQEADAERCHWADLMPYVEVGCCFNTALFRPEIIAGRVLKVAGC